MNEMSDKLTVAVIQASPVFMNLEASLTKAVSLIEQAANKGAKLVAFGETWLAGYPAWLDYCPNAAFWNHEPTREVFARLRRNSVVVPGEETKTLGEIAAKHKIVLTIGINERVEQGGQRNALQQLADFRRGRHTRGSSPQARPDLYRKISLGTRRRGGTQFS